MKKFLLCLSMALLWPSTAGAATIVDYAFDGDALDSSGNGLHGALTGGTFVSGRNGQALQLDGNDYVSVVFPNILPLSQFTIESWINVPSYDRNVHYVSLQQGSHYLVLGDYSSGMVSTWANGLNPIQVNGGDASSQTNVWRHIAFSYDGSTQRVFVDGQLVNSVATSGSLTGSYNEGLVIGARYSENTQFVVGLLDDVRIHDVALDASQLGYFDSAGAVPEPSTWAMMLLGFFGIGGILRSNRRKQKVAVSYA